MDKWGVLKKYFGYDQFREGQEFLIDQIIAGRDVLGVMPTGAGKSVCFQVPALLFSGITIVLSPLISLMKDQVNALTQAGVKAAFLNSSLTAFQYKSALRNAQNGQYKIIYVAPERLLTEEFMAFAQNIRISMVTVDEAHCISQWGQDFRPSYLKIMEFIKRLPARPILSAFTATATQRVRQDILGGLQLSDPAVLVAGFDRKNLFFSVEKPADKDGALLRFLERRKDKSGIVYCSTRKAVDEVCGLLRQKGYEAARYHAGLADEERKNNQELFLYDRVSVMVATNAFGMGIDKSNVSFVVHYNMPRDIESYYQEAGRAGRDGQSAECLLLYKPQDVQIQTYLINHREKKEEIDKETEEILKQREREKLKLMTFYCNTQDCLRKYILRYFGEDAPACRDNCGNCVEQYEDMDSTVPAQKIISCVCRVNERFGIKMVMDILRGSRSERIQNLGLDQLSTYNIMSESEQELRQLIQALVEQDYLSVTNDEYPLLKLGSRAQEALKNRAPVMIKRRKEEPATLKESVKSRKWMDAAGDADAALLMRLKKLRLAIAIEQKVPAFVVFTDNALADMCAKLPLSEREFLQVSGVGQAKLERYGRAFLREISEYVRENGGAEKRKREKQEDVIYF